MICRCPERRGSAAAREAARSGGRARRGAARAGGDGGEGEATLRENTYEQRVEEMMMQDGR